MTQMAKQTKQQTISNLVEVVGTFFLTFLHAQVEASNIKENKIDNIIGNLKEQREELKKLIIKNSGVLVDPTKPKAPKSAYMQFCENHREEVKAENPELKMTDHAKILGKLWEEAKSTSSKEYKKLLKNFEQEKAEYEILKKEHVSPSDDDLLEMKENKFDLKVKKAGKPKKKRPADYPKKYKTAKQMFIKAQRPEAKKKCDEYIVSYREEAGGEDWDLSRSDKIKYINSMINEKWESLSEKKKATLLKASEEDKKRYETEMKAWLEEHPEDAPAEKGKGKGKGKKRPLDLPKKNKSAYQLFQVDVRDKAKSSLEEEGMFENVEGKEKLKMVNGKLKELWTGLKASKKTKYETKAEEDKKRYETEMAEYNERHANDEEEVEEEEVEEEEAQHEEEEEAQHEEEEEARPLPTFVTKPSKKNRA